MWLMGQPAEDAPLRPTLGECSRSASLRCLLDVIDLAPPEQVIQSAHSIPAIAISLNDQPVFALLVALTVLLAQQIHETPRGLIVQADGETELMRLGIEIMHEQHPVIAPSIAYHENGRIAGRDKREVAPAN